jgi:hypothetical protein
VLKIRAKKLAQLDDKSGASGLVTTSTTNSVFFDGVSAKLAGLSFYRKDLTTDINSAYSSLLFKNEAFYQFNFLMLNQFKIVTFFM